MIDDDTFAHYAVSYGILSAAQVKACRNAEFAEGSGGRGDGDADPVPERGCDFVTPSHGTGQGGATAEVSGRAEDAGTGGRVPLAEAAVRKGFLTREQADALRSALGDARRGHLIEGYEIRGRLARGGMGAVYRARQRSMNRDVAIKVLHPRQARDPEAKERFLREARAVAKLNHPNIVTGIDAGIAAGGLHYFVMELVEGESLRTLLRAEGRLPWARAREIAVQTARGLDHAHRHGLVHRDVKPENILLSRATGEAKLADLGLVRFEAAAAADPRLTQAGTVMGTPHYLSPEQARADADLDGRTDLYSLGICLYEMLYGRPPFDGDAPAVILSKHLTGKLAFPADVPDVPARCREILRILLAKDRGERPETAADAVQLLTADRPGSAEGADPVPERGGDKVAPAHGTGQGVQRRKRPAVSTPLRGGGDEVSSSFPASPVPAWQRPVLIGAAILGAALAAAAAGWLLAGSG